MHLFTDMVCITSTGPSSHIGLSSHQQLKNNHPQLICSDAVGVDSPNDFWLLTGGDVSLFINSALFLLLAGFAVVPVAGAAALAVLALVAVVPLAALFACHALLSWFLHPAFADGIFCMVGVNAACLAGALLSPTRGGMCGSGFLDHRAENKSGAAAAQEGNNQNRSNSSNSSTSLIYDNNTDTDTSTAAVIAAAWRSGFLRRTNAPDPLTR